MLSLGIFLCMIFVLYSVNTSNHFIKGTDYFLIIAVVHFHMSFGFRIIQYFESLSQLSLRYICTDNILYKCLFMNVDIRYEICTVNFLIYLHDIQDSLWYTLLYFGQLTLNLPPKIPSSLPKYIFLEPQTALTNPNCNNYKPYLPRQMNETRTLMQP